MILLEAKLKYAVYIRSVAIQEPGKYMVCVDL